MMKSRETPAYTRVLCQIRGSSPCLVQLLLDSQWTEHSLLCDTQDLVISVLIPVVAHNLLLSDSDTLTSSLYSAIDPETQIKSFCVCVARQHHTWDGKTLTCTLHLTETNVPGIRSVESKAFCHLNDREHVR